jgi:hypothetical protein
MQQQFRGDLWKVNWEEAAEKTVQSGFDKRRIKVEKDYDKKILSLSILNFPGGARNGAGPWLNSSPFAAPVEPNEDGILTFPLQDRDEAYFSEQGILRISGKDWMFYE